MLGRNAIGVDINSGAIAIAKKRLALGQDNNSRIEFRKGSATNLDFIKDQSIDLVCMHPPYANIIQYSENISEDLSLFKYEEFLTEMRKVAKEAYRVLKNNKICAYMIGDIRKNGNVTPLGFKTMELFCKEGFILKEIIIKEQHNCRSSDYWKNKKKSFLLLAHEYIFVLKKER